MLIHSCVAQSGSYQGRLFTLKVQYVCHIRTFTLQTLKDTNVPCMPGAVLHY